MLKHSLIHALFFYPLLSQAKICNFSVDLVIQMTNVFLKIYIMLKFCQNRVNTYIKELGFLYLLCSDAVFGSTEFLALKESSSLGGVLLPIEQC